MIPKVIHYCWFSGDPYPSLIKKCLNSWEKVLIGYTFKKWDASSLDFSIPFVQKAYNEKKWAFLTDYIRFKVLYEEGGIYLDTDVLMVKSFDDLLHFETFWNFADNGMVEPVVIGAQQGSKIIGDCKKKYEDLTVTELELYKYTEVPKIITPIFTKLGLKSYEFSSQEIGDNVIFKHTYFCPMPFEKASMHGYKKFISTETYCVHMWNADWFDDEFRFFWNNRWRKGWMLVWKRLIKNPFQSVHYYKDVFYHLIRQLKF